jgi:mannose-6-phosphate isomerase-like protein (cupin superfamily)
MTRWYDADVDKPVVAPDRTLVVVPPRCLRVAFHPSGENPYVAFSATDGRGAVHGLDLGSVPPHLVEIIHSEPHVVRGNHVHRRCTETFTVLTGDIRMYLLCRCPEGHLLEMSMAAGTTVTIPPGTPHAMFADTRSECVAVFGGGDPRDDRDRVTLLE